MGRLKNSLFYLTGAIDRSSDNGVGWRRTVTPTLEELGINVFDPTNKPPIFGYSEDSTHIALKKKLREEKRYDELADLMHKVRNVDLRVVDHATCLFTHLDFRDSPCGTWEECFTSNRAKKPSVIHFEQGIDSAPDWLFGVYRTDWREFFYEDWDAMFEYLRYVDKGGRASDRWVLFDF
jgi:hypothetical protein